MIAFYFGCLGGSVCVCVCMWVRACVCLIRHCKLIKIQMLVPADVMIYPAHNRLLLKFGVNLMRLLTINSLTIHVRSKNPEVKKASQFVELSIFPIKGEANMINNDKHTHFAV